MFAIRGLFRGLLAQILGVVGVMLGIWTGAVIAQWVGAHWQGAQPAVIFWTLRWLVTVLGALAVMSLFHVISEWVSGAMRETPLGGVDRVAGLVGGGVVGLAVVSLIVLGAVLLPVPHWVRNAAAGARWSRPLLEAGSSACALAHKVPGSTVLRRQYVVATHRLDRRPTRV
jgi:uncharacterized membrane protein required for colicin V production